jgi:hypothetical protein
MADDPNHKKETLAEFRLRTLVGQVNQNSDENAIRELGRLCAHSREDGCGFYQSLLDQGMTPAMIGGLKMLFRREEIWGGFLRRENPLTWAEAEAQARLALAAEVAEIVARLDSAEGARNAGSFRQLCRLAHEWGIDPESYRRLLVGAGLAKSRASEIKSVLESPLVCKAFIRPTNSIGWNTALQQSRANPTSELKLAARHLIRQLIRYCRKQIGTETDFSIMNGELNVFREPSGRFCLVHPTDGTLVLEPILPKTAQASSARPNHANLS